MDIGFFFYVLKNTKISHIGFDDKNHLKTFA